MTFAELAPLKRHLVVMKYFDLVSLLFNVDRQLTDLRFRRLGAMIALEHYISGDRE